MRILIAEDDVTSRCVLEAVLVKWGHEVVSTADGDEAWAQLQEPGAPKLAILDWMMPGKDGVDLCRLVRGRPGAEPTYLILLTALAAKHDVVRGLEAGADDYLTKPFDRDELRARIRVGERVVELQGTLALRVRELEDALAQVKTLRGVLPICMYCHKIRNDAQSWERVEQYVSEHTDAQFSHGICEECLAVHFPGVVEPPAPGTTP